MSATQKAQSKKPSLVRLLQESKPVIENQDLFGYLRQAQEKSRLEKDKGLSVGEIERITLKLGVKGGNEFGRLLRYYPDVARQLLARFRTVRVLQQVERRPGRSCCPEAKLTIERPGEREKWCAWKINHVVARKEPLFRIPTRPETQCPALVAVDYSGYDSWNILFVPAKSLPQGLTCWNAEHTFHLPLAVPLYFWMPKTVYCWREHDLSIGAEEDLPKEQGTACYGPNVRLFKGALKYPIVTTFECDDLWLDEQGVEWCMFKISTKSLSLEDLYFHLKFESSHQSSEVAWNALSGKLNFLDGARALWGTVLNENSREMQQRAFEGACEHIVRRES